MKDFRSERSYSLGLRTSPGRLGQYAMPLVRKSRTVEAGQMGWVVVLVLVIASEIAVVAWQLFGRHS